MASLVITPANLVVTATPIPGTSGEALTMGHIIYLNSTTGKWLKCPADIGSGVLVGMLVSGSVAANQPILVLIQKEVVVTFGAIITAKAIYCISDVDGEIEAAPDLPPAEAIFIVGVGLSTTTMRMLFQYTGA